MAEQIVIEYIANVDGLTAGLKNVKEELKTTQKAAEDAGTKTSDALGKSEVATKSLKAQLRELKAQLANATDPKDIERLAKAAGKLSDQIEDATDAARIFASESKFEQVGNAIGSIGSKLRNLDFKGAADQAKLLGSVLRSVTAKDAISGLKDIGNAIFSIGEAVVGNALFLVPAAMAAIAYSTYDAIKAYQQFFLDTKTVSEATAEAAKQFANFGDRTRNAYIGIQETLGIYSKQQADSLRKDNETAKTKTEIQKKLNDDLKKLAAELNTDMSYSDMAKLAAQGRLNDELIQRKIKYEAQAIKLQKIANEEIARLETASRSEKILIAITGYKEEEKAAKEKSAKLQEEAKKNNDALIAEQERLEKMLRDLRTQNIESDYERRKQIIIDNFNDEAKKYKGHNDIIIELEKKKNRELNDLAEERNAKNNKIIKDSQKDYVKIFKDNIKGLDETDTAFSESLKKKMDDIVDKQKKSANALKELQDNAFNYVGQLATSLTTIYANNLDQQQIDLENKNKAESDELEKLYKNKEISEVEYNERKNQLDKKQRQEEAKIKQAKFEADRSAALIQVAINTAASIAKTLSDVGLPAGLPLIAIAAALGAAQIAAIESQPVPKFEKGGWIEGKLHSQGGTIIEAEKDEFVINRKAAAMNSGLIEAINSGNAEKYIEMKYIAPILKEQAKRFEERKQEMFADSLVSSMMLNSASFKDSNLLESLKKSRQADKENTEYLARVLKGNINARKF